MSRKTPQKDHYILKNLRISVIIASFLIIIGLGWAFLSEKINNWKEDQRQQHLDDVLAACLNSENSNLCSKLKKKYSITFKYCRSYADPMDKQAYTVTLPDGSPYLIYDPIWHGVAWEGDSPTPPSQSFGLGSYNFYYDCTDHIDTKASD